MTKKRIHTEGLHGAELEKAISRMRVSKVAQSKRYTRSKYGNAVYVTLFILMGCFSILPLVYCIATSFKPLDELMVFPPRFFVHRPTVQNYLVLPSLLSNLKVPLSRYIFNSVFVSVTSTVLYVFSSAMSAFALSKSNVYGKKVMFHIIQYALLFNSYTLAIPQYLIYSYLGIIDTYAVYIFPMLMSTMGVFLMKQYSNYWVPRVARLEAYNNGNMYYTKNEENISLSKGKLLLTGRWHETEKNSLTSGYIKTEGNLSYQYGYAEILARLPKGNGVWPAFWALGTDTKAYQEIDFFEMFTNNSSRVTAAIHKWWIGLDSSGAEMRGHSSTNEKGRDYDLPNGETFNDDWHTFGCEWTPEEMRFFVDGEHYYTYDISGEGQDIHHTPVYLILCLQIGIAGMAKGVDETTPMPSVYEIEYVRLYQRPSYSKLILK